MKDRAMDPGVRSFLQGLEAAARRYSLLSHPFYQLWIEGRLTLSILAEYAKQYYAHVRAVPTYLSAVHSCCGEIRVRQTLLESLIEEERGDENHPELWLRLAESLGLRRDETRSATLLPTTLESVKLMRELAQRADCREGVAALWTWGFQSAEVARAMRDALADRYGITDARGLACFGVEETASGRHTRDFQEILVSRCLTDESRSRAVRAAAMSARTRWNFVDGIYAACVPEEVRGAAVAH